MSLMSKLLMSTVLATVTLSATPSKEILLNYVKKVVVKNPQVKVKDIKIIEERTVESLKGWQILLTTMDLEYQKKQMSVPEMMFIKDGVIAPDLIDLATGKDYRKNIKPSVPKSFYNEEHRLFGNKDAKHKILVFSDPECPFCRDVVPGLLKAAKENPSKIALYYYHLPLLRIHPVSDVLTRVMYVAQKEGKTDVVEKMYTLKIDAREKNVTKILSAIKSHTGYSISAAKIDKKEIEDAIRADEKSAGRMMVAGTPTIYIDGKWDKQRDGYKKLISFF